MTKLELMEMLNGVDDNAEITFVQRCTSAYDIYSHDEEVKVYKVIGGAVATLTDEHGMTELEAVSEDMEFVESKKMVYGKVINYYTRK